MNSRIHRGELKMGVKNVVKKGFLSGLNPLRWIGYEQIAQNGRTIKNMVDGMVKPSNGKTDFRPTSFEECMQHYKLTEEELKIRMRNSYRIALVCFIASFFMAAYVIYLFVHGLPLAGIVCVMLTLLLWSYAFREHFNYFQMKRRRLGCTFKDWFVAVFKGKKQ